jgi:hypothetical protein
MISTVVLLNCIGIGIGIVMTGWRSWIAAKPASALLIDRSVE